MAGFKCRDPLGAKRRGAHRFYRAEVRTNEEGISSRSAGENEVQHAEAADPADFAALQPVAGRRQGRHLFEFEVTSATR